MSNTRKTLQMLSKGFEKIKDATCSPWAWACGEYDKSESCFNIATKNAKNSNIVFAAAAGGLIDNIISREGVHLTPLSLRTLLVYYRRYLKVSKSIRGNHVA